MSSDLLDILKTFQQNDYIGGKPSRSCGGCSDPGFDTVALITVVGYDYS